MSIEDQTTTPAHIQIPNDTLIPDEEFCRLVLGGCTRRTASRYEAYAAGPRSTLKKLEV